MDKLELVVKKENVSASAWKPLMVSASVYDQVSDLAYKIGWMKGDLINKLLPFALDHVEIISSNAVRAEVESFTEAKSDLDTEVIVEETVIEVMNVEEEQALRKLVKKEAVRLVKEGKREALKEINERYGIDKVSDLGMTRLEAYLEEVRGL